MKKTFKSILTVGILTVALTGCKKTPEEEKPTPEPTPVTLESIAVTSDPTNKTYFVGDDFDPTGMIVTALYSDKTTKAVNHSDLTFAYDFETAGTNKTVTINYEGKTATLTVTVNFFAGDGLNDNPYLIGNAAQLAKLAELVNAGNNAYNDKYYKLNGDIDLSAYGTSWNSGGGWIPIGNSDSNPFFGNFDGAGFTVSNLYINRTGNFTGLFGMVDGGNITNLGIANADITGRDRVGGVAGRVQGGGSITNCYVTGVVSGNHNVGGVTGNFYNGNITNCYVTGVVKGDGWVGGVAGDLDVCDVTNCYAAAAVSGNSYVGGLVGNAAGNVTNCAALNSNITRNDGSTATQFGRVAGQIFSSSTLSNNIALEDMEALGGITFGAGAHDNRDGADITAEDAKKQKTYEDLGWDFTTVWKIEEGVGYPELRIAD